MVCGYRYPGDGPEWARHRAARAEITKNFDPYFHEYTSTFLPFCRKVACKYREFTVQG